MSVFTRQAVSDLEDYQQRFVQAVSRVIAGNWLLKRPAVRILDMGCDCSGRQLREIVKLIGGTAVGVNIPADFPSRKAVAAAGDRVQLLRMDGMQLQFPDESFDLVVSANVIEHVPDPVRFIREAARVLKPDGVCYMETAPVWSGPRGHHIMECMVAENCPQETAFRDDGTVIPDWAHLTLTRQQLSERLAQKLQPETCQYILHYLYDTADLNKRPWSVIRSAFEQSFPISRINSRPLGEVDQNSMPADEREDYSVYGFDAVCRKRPQRWLTAKFSRRLRRIGL
jgi:ubiquinone/menaquinone biosynthesis C-methylase UbiE